MNGKYLLDSNVVSAFLGDDRTVQQRVRDAEDVLSPAVVVGELLYGALKSGRREENEARLRAQIPEDAVLPCDYETAMLYGAVKNQLRLKGTPIPLHDIWIAALGLQYDLTLATRDAHFDNVDGLKVER